MSILSIMTVSDIAMGNWIDRRKLSPIMDAKIEEIFVIA